MMKNIGDFIDDYRVLAIQEDMPTFRLYIVEHVSEKGHPLLLKMWKEAYDPLFHTQAQALKDLHASCILPVKDFGVSEKTYPYLVYPNEAISLQTLQKRLERRDTDPISEAMARSILTEVGTALIIAHQQRIGHGFLTPENILLTLEGKGLLAGFSPMITHPKQQRRAPKSRYQSPEGGTSRLSDVYALGALARDVLFEHQSASSTRQAIKRALATQPVDRSHSVREFLHQLDIAISIPQTREEALPTLSTVYVPLKNPGRTGSVALISAIVGLLLILGVVCFVGAYSISTNTSIDPNIPVTCNGRPMDLEDTCIHVDTVWFSTHSTSYTYDQQADYQQSSGPRTAGFLLDILGGFLILLGILAGWRFLVFLRENWSSLVKYPVK